MNTEGGFESLPLLPTLQATLREVRFEAPTEVLHNALRQLRQKVELERVDHAFQNLALAG